MPILKQLAPQQSKRRSRPDLTREMISAPLGDFRHTMHVGRGGDAFGDTSFLGSRPPTSPAASSPSTLQPLPEEEVGGEEGTAPPPLTPKGGAGEDEEGRVRPGTSPGGMALRRTDSVLSFHVDLGPSMLGDVLGVMEIGGPPQGPQSPGEQGPGTPPRVGEGEESEWSGREGLREEEEDSVKGKGEVERKEGEWREGEEERRNGEREERSGSIPKKVEEEEEEEEEDEGGECYTFDEEEQDDEIHV
ncbi:cdc42 effector protein 5 [Mobula birostris]|uniref:cdc42 effector protein 5 n=1 Tax=Mobula birostris TaxID=1983395 RepID=UPI003B286F8C